MVSERRATSFQLWERAQTPGLPGAHSTPARCLAQKRPCDQGGPISICPGTLLRATGKAGRVWEPRAGEDAGRKQRA